jgi:transposase
MKTTCLSPNTANKNLQIITEVLQVMIGIRLLKQVLCIILLIFDVDEKKIMSELNVSYNTIKKYSSLLNTGKLSELFEDNVYRRKSEMEDYREKIMAELDKNPVRSLREAAVIIENVTGLKRSLPQVRNFLKKTVTDR